MATAKLELKLAGSASSVPVEVTGHGSVHTDMGRLALQVRVARPLPLLAPPLVALGAIWPDAVGDGDAAEHGPDADAGQDPDSHAHVRVRTDLYDEHGREAGGWRVVAALGRMGGVGLPASHDVSPATIRAWGEGRARRPGLLEPVWGRIGSRLHGHR